MFAAGLYIHGVCICYKLLGARLSHILRLFQQSFLFTSENLVESSPSVQVTDEDVLREGQYSHAANLHLGHGHTGVRGYVL